MKSWPTVLPRSEKGTPHDRSPLVVCVVDCVRRDDVGMEEAMTADRTARKAFLAGWAAFKKADHISNEDMWAPNMTTKEFRDKEWKKYVSRLRRKRMVRAHGR